MSAGGRVVAGEQRPRCGGDARCTTAKRCTMAEVEQRLDVYEGVVTEATNTVDKHGVDLGESHHLEGPHGTRAKKARKNEIGRAHV